MEKLNNQLLDEANELFKQEAVKRDIDIDNPENTEITADPEN